MSALGDPFLVECDATDVSQVEAAYSSAVAALGGLDLVVHSIAYAERDDLGGDFSNTGLEGFRTALEVSAFTLIPITALAVPHMGESGGSVVTLTFDASDKVYPGYNIMGTAKAALENEVRQLAAEFGPKSVRVNAVSAGPLPTQPEASPDLTRCGVRTPPARRSVATSPTKRSPTPRPSC